MHQEFIRPPFASKRDIASQSVMMQGDYCHEFANSVVSENAVPYYGGIEFYPNGRIIRSSSGRWFTVFEPTIPWGFVFPEMVKPPQQELPRTLNLLSRPQCASELWPQWCISYWTKFGQPISWNQHFQVVPYNWEYIENFNPTNLQLGNFTGTQINGVRKLEQFINKVPSERVSENFSFKRNITHFSKHILEKMLLVSDSQQLADNLRSAEVGKVDNRETTLQLQYSKDKKVGHCRTLNKLYFDSGTPMEHVFNILNFDSRTHTEEKADKLCSRSGFIKKSPIVVQTEDDKNFRDVFFFDKSKIAERNPNGRSVGSSIASKTSKTSRGYGLALSENECSDKKKERDDYRLELKLPMNESNDEVKWIVSTPVSQRLASEISTTPGSVSLEGPIKSQPMPELRLEETAPLVRLVTAQPMLSLPKKLPFVVEQTVEEDVWHTVKKRKSRKHSCMVNIKTSTARKSLSTNYVSRYKLLQTEEKLRKRKKKKRNVKSVVKDKDITSDETKSLPAAKCRRGKCSMLKEYCLGIFIWCTKKES